MQTIDAKELKQLMDSKKEIGILDVRENEEYNICKIPNSQLIPLGALPDRVNELDPNREYVVHCHHGGRSAKAIDFLRSVGFNKLRNLTGGIDAWSEDVDPSCMRY